MTEPSSRGTKSLWAPHASGNEMDFILMDKTDGNQIYVKINRKGQQV